MQTKKSGILVRLIAGTHRSIYLSEITFFEFIQPMLWQRFIIATEPFESCDWSFKLFFFYENGLLSEISLSSVHTSDLKLLFPNQTPIEQDGANKMKFIFFRESLEKKNESLGGSYLASSCTKLLQQKKKPCSTSAI